MATEPIDPTAVQTRPLIGRIQGNTISYRATGHRKNLLERGRDAAVPSRSVWLFTQACASGSKELMETVGLNFYFNWFFSID
ncbi:hypothetical protein N7454_009926 [Penicillium verhagenii]|nr:hypothetical protein N7454_009926 [Penicillium verhagenii]